VPEVTLRPMTAGEYREYLARATPDYADEVQRNTGIGRPEALRHAERVFRDLLPDGVTTRGHRLLLAFDADTGERVGLLWVAEQRREGAPVAWVYDIKVEEALRGRGYGRALMLRAEEQARDMGITRLELNVFGDNPVARNLYRSLGYGEMSRQLYKDL
jgi:ribosomal protein S18 acetylase RimI-like enzyme